MEGAVDKEKLAKLQRMAAGVRVGGKGSVRRKKKAVHKAAPTDDKRLQTTLKRLQLSQLPGIEEVNIFKDNGSVINFQNPKVQAQISANTYVISGNAVTKPLQEMLPSIVNQLGADNMPQMKSLMDQLGAGMSGGKPDNAAQAGKGADGGEDDDEIPDLVENVTFEDKAASAEKVDVEGNNDDQANIDGKDDKDNNGDKDDNDVKGDNGVVDKNDVMDNNGVNDSKEVEGNDEVVETGKKDESASKDDPETKA